MQQGVTRGLRELLKSLQPDDGYSGTQETILAIKLMVLTLPRTNEMRWARCTEIDMPECVWCVPAERMKGTLAAKASGIPHLG